MLLAALLRPMKRYSTTLTMIIAVAGSTLALGAVNVEEGSETAHVEAGVRVRMLSAKSRPVADDLQRVKRLAIETKLRELAALPVSDVDVDPEVWDDLAACESDHRWDANTGNGYYGGLQFALTSWRAVGGSGYPHEAPRDVQIAYAERLLERQGWNAWPSCSRQLGLL